MATKVLAQYHIQAFSTLTGSDFAFINHFEHPMVVTVELLEPDPLPEEPIDAARQEPDYEE